MDGPKGQGVKVSREAKGTVRITHRNADGSVRWALYFRRTGHSAETIPCTRYHREEDRNAVERWAEGIRAARRGMVKVTAGEAETVAQWFARYFTWRASQPMGGESVADSRGRIRKWVEPRIGGLQIRTLTREQLDDLVDFLDRAVVEDRLAWKTACNVWGEVSAGLAVAASAKRASGLRVRDDNPAAGVAGPTKGITKIKPVLRPSEIVKLLSCTDVPIDRRHVYATAIYSAMRQGELRALRVGDIDLDAMQISVTRQRKNGKEKARTKTGRARRVAIEPNLVPLLRALTEGRPADAFVLRVTAHNRCASHLRSDLLTAGVDRTALHVETPTTAHLTFHNLRDTCLTHMAVRRDPPQDVQWRAGHTTLAMTEKYIAQARYEAGPSFGTPLGPIPTALIHPDPDSVIESVIVIENTPKTPAKWWRRRESKDSRGVGESRAGTCT